MDRSTVLRIARSLRPTPPQRPRRKPQHQRFKSNASDKQAYPLKGFYADMLSAAETKPKPRDAIQENKHLLDIPKQKIQPATRTAPEAPPPESLPKTEKEEVLERARVVFGSRLAGPVERKDEKDKASTDVAGVKVPPKPSEPDNCCMSGCVHCVWDVYRDDLEEWAVKSKQAKEALVAQKGTAEVEEKMPAHVVSSMDDDGGGSETNWQDGGKDEGDLFGNVPVGIREFMKTEKLLKQKHAEEGSVGG